MEARQRSVRIWLVDSPTEEERRKKGRKLCISHILSDFPIVFHLSFAGSFQQRDGGGDDGHADLPGSGG